MEIGETLSASRKTKQVERQVVRRKEEKGEFEIARGRLKEGSVPYVQTPHEDDGSGSDTLRQTDPLCDELNDCFRLVFESMCLERWAERCLRIERLVMKNLKLLISSNVKYSRSLKLATLSMSSFLKIHFALSSCRRVVDPDVGQSLGHTSRRNKRLTHWFEAQKSTTEGG